MINLHLAKPIILVNFLARLVDLAFHVVEEVAVGNTIIVQTDFVEVRVHIFADIINGGGASPSRTNVSGKFLGIGREVGEVRWRTLVWQIVLPEVKLGKI